MRMLPAFQPANVAVAQQSSFLQGRAAYRRRLVKLVCALGIGVCFWYAVPYTFPLQLDPDPMKAAASEASAYEGNLSRQIAMPLILMVSAFLLYRLPARGRLLSRSKVLGCALGYIAWSTASLSWTCEPAITHKRIVVFAIDAFFAYALARVASESEIALFGFVATGVVALIALCADVLVLHNFAPFDPDYRFMGVMTANYQAMNLFVCLVCGLTVVQQHPRRVRHLAPLLVLFAGLLFLTRARIGTFLFIAAFGFFATRFLKDRLHPHGRALAALALFALSAPVATFAIGQSGGNALTSVFMMGRQDTENTASLSNRAPLWGELLHSVAEHPVLGFGFEAFWSPERVQTVSAHQGWVVPHAHNTYLDQVLSLGLVGCFLYVGMLLGALVVAWKRYKRRQESSALLPAILLSWLALLSLTESIPVAPCLPVLIAYTCVAKMCLTDEAEEHRSRNESGERKVSGRPARYLAALARHAQAGEMPG